MARKDKARSENYNFFLLLLWKAIQAHESAAFTQCWDAAWHVKEGKACMRVHLLLLNHVLCGGTGVSMEMENVFSPLHLCHTAHQKIDS